MPSKPDTLIGCSIILLQELPITSRVDSVMMFKKEPVSINAPLQFHVNIGCEVKWSLWYSAISACSFYRKPWCYHRMSSLGALFWTRPEPPDKSVSSMVVFVITSADLHQNPFVNKLWTCSAIWSRSGSLSGVCCSCFSIPISLWDAIITWPLSLSPTLRNDKSLILVAPSWNKSLLALASHRKLFGKYRRCSNVLPFFL